MIINKVAPLLALISIFSLKAGAIGVKELETLVSKIAGNNGQYAAEQMANAAQIKSMQTENNLSDPEIDFTHQWGQKGVGNKYDIGISQSFDWPGAYGARKEATKLTANALDWLALQNLCDLRLKIRQTMIDCISARKRIELYGVVLMTVDSLIQIVERNVQNRELSVLDANRLKIERIAFANKYEEATVAYNEACNSLTEMNGGKACPEVWSELTDYPTETMLRPLEAYREESELFNPQGGYRKAMKDTYLAQAKAVKRSSMPGFSLGYSHEYEMGDRFNGVSVSMSLPVFSIKGKRKAKELELEAFKMETEQEEIAVTSRIDGDYSKAKILSKQIGDYSDVFHGESHIKLLNKAFEARQLTVVDYLTDLIYFTQAKSDYYELEYRYNLQLASLDRYSWLANK